MATKVPSYKYVGGSHSNEVKDGYWYIYLKGSGTLTLDYKKTGVEVCVVGGGAGGYSDADTRDGGAGGKGGAVVNKTNVTIAPGTGYPVTVGAGGYGAKALSSSSEATAGSASSAFGTTAAGGAVQASGGNGAAGTGGAHPFSDSSLAMVGGSGGGGGIGVYGSTGSSSTSRDGGLGVAGGGNGGEAAFYGAGKAGTSGAENTGGGGGGEGNNHTWEEYDGSWSFASGGKAGDGGSGIVIVRGKEDDLIPVWYNGVQLAKIFFNGVELEHLSYGGKQLYARVIKLIRRWRACLNCPEPEFA